MVLLYSDSDCGNKVKYTPRYPAIVGSIPARCLACFSSLPQYSLNLVPRGGATQLLFLKMTDWLCCYNARYWAKSFFLFLPDECSSKEREKNVIGLEMQQQI